MPIFRKELLRTGVYKKGKSFEVRDEHLKAFDTTYNRQLAPAGLLAPLCWEHESPGAAGGAPLSLSDLLDKKRSEAKHNAGFLLRTEVKDDRLYGIFDVRDPEDAKRLSQEQVRFVSPELRASWEDGKGRRYRNVISHVALTHKPVICDQEPGFKEVQLSDDAPDNLFEGILRLSAETATAIALADDEESLGEQGYEVSGDSEAENENPDLPTDESPEEWDPKLEALIAHLEALGLPLPSDTDMGNLVDRLLTACMVKKAHEDKQKTEDAEDDSTDANMEDVEEAQPQLMQMSMSTDLGRRIQTALREHRISPALATKLQQQLTLQLSSGGSDSAAIGLVDLVEMLEDFPQLSAVTEQLANTRERKHPRGVEFLRGEMAGLDDPNSAASKKAAKAFLQRTGRAPQTTT